MKTLIKLLLICCLSTPAFAEECAETQMCASETQMQQLQMTRKIYSDKSKDELIDSGTRDYYKKQLVEFDRCYEKHMSVNRPRLAHLFCLSTDVVSVKIEHALLEIDPENPDITTEIIEYER